MKNNAVMLVVTLILGVFSAGCGATRASHYYQLNVLSGARVPASEQPLPVTILVSRFYSSHLYREDRIVYSTQHESMGLYQYERWAEPPAEMLDEMLVRRLRHSHRYRQVYSMRSSVHGDYLLRGHLYDLKEVDTGSGLVARVSFDAELLDAKTRNLLWTHTYTHDEPAAAKTIDAVVAALDRNAQAGIADLADSLDAYFTAHPPANAPSSSTSGQN